MRGVIPPLPNESSRRGAYISSGYVFMVWNLVKRTGNFAFLYDKVSRLIMKLA